MPSPVHSHRNSPHPPTPNSPEQDRAPARASAAMGRPSSFKQGPATSTGKELRRSVSEVHPRPRAGGPTAAAASFGRPNGSVVINPASALGPGHHTAEARAQIGTASSFSGEVEMKYGRHTSPQPVVNALLSYARNELAGLKLDGTASLTLTLDPGARPMYEALHEHCAVEEVDIVANERSALLADRKAAIDGNVLIPLLQQVLMKGRAAFGENAHINVNGRSLQVHDHLATLYPSVVSNQEALAEPISQKIAADPDLRAKLAAAALLQIATKKNFTPGGLLGSLTVSSGLGSVWELLAAPAVKASLDTLLKQTGLPSPSQALLTSLMGAGVDSVPPVVIESLDTLFVLSILKTMKGDKDWTFKGLIPNALKAGAISSALSVPNNLMQYFSTGSKSADFAINTVTTEAAIFGAASGVPMEIQENSDNLRAAQVQSHNDGLFAPPAEGTEPHRHVAQMTQRALDIEPSASLAQKSMAVAATVGMVPLLLSDKALNLVPESVLRIVRSTAFNPIEAIALNALVLGARVRLPGIFTSDHDKHADLTRLVLQKAATGPGGGEHPIQDKELDGIFNPPQEVLGRTGAFIAQGINTAMRGAQSLAAKVGLTTPSEALDPRMDYESMRQPRTATAV